MNYGVKKALISLGLGVIGLAASLGSTLIGVSIKGSDLEDGSTKNDDVIEVKVEEVKDND